MSVTHCAIDSTSSVCLRYHFHCVCSTFFRFGCNMLFLIWKLMRSLRSIILKAVCCWVLLALGCRLSSSEGSLSHAGAINHLGCLHPVLIFSLSQSVLPSIWVRLSYCFTQKGEKWPSDRHSLRLGLMASQVVRMLHKCHRSFAWSKASPRWEGCRWFPGGVPVLVQLSSLQVFFWGFSLLHKWSWSTVLTHLMLLSI